MNARLAPWQRWHDPRVFAWAVLFRDSARPDAKDTKNIEKLIELVRGLQTRYRSRDKTLPSKCARYLPDCCATIANVSSDLCKSMMVTSSPS